MTTTMLERTSSSSNDIWLQSRDEAAPYRQSRAHTPLTSLAKTNDAMAMNIWTISEGKRARAQRVAERLKADPAEIASPTVNRVVETAAASKLVLALISEWAAISSPTHGTRKCLMPSLALSSDKLLLTGLADAARRLHAIMDFSSFEHRPDNTVEIVQTFGISSLRGPSLRSESPIASTQESKGNVGAVSDVTPVWLEKLLHGRDAEAPSGALRALFVGIRSSVDDGRMADLERHLTDLEVGRMPSKGLVALLRYTFPIRSKIACWRQLLASAEKELLTRGVKTDITLRGLDAS